jgi:hypothetical protein
MVSAGDIRAGGAYVELGIKDSAFDERLARSQARLKQWVAENARAAAAPITRANEGALAGAGAAGGPGGFFRGSFRSAELFEGGIRFVAAIQAARVAIKDVQIFSALVRGDFDGMRKAAEALPFGLGEVVKQLSGPVDEWCKGIALRLTGLADFTYDKGAAQKAAQDRKAEVEQYNRFLQAYDAAEKAVQKATLSAREYARWEVEGMKLTEQQAGKVLALKYKQIEADENKQADRQRAEAAKHYSDELAKAMDEVAKLRLGEEGYIEYQVRAMNLTAEAAQSLIGWKKEALRLEKEHKKAEEDARKARQAAEEAAREEQRSRLEEFDEAERNFKRYEEEAARLKESLMSPKEKFERQRELLTELRDAEMITQDEWTRGIYQAMEEAAKDMPDEVERTIGVRGTFNALQAEALGAGDASDAIAHNTDKTAKAAEKVARLIEEWGVALEYG